MEGHTSGDATSTQNPRTIDELTRIIEQQGMLLQTLMEQQRRSEQQPVQPPQEQPPPVHEVRNDESYRATERFMRFNPPEFVGGTDPKKAETWLTTIERTFNCARVSDADKVSCALCLLRDDASEWWLSMRTIHDERTVTWEQFRQLLEEKYFTKALKDEKAREFLYLKQRKMTIEECLRKFEELSRYAPHMVATDELKTQHFLNVINPTIYKDLVVADLDGASFSKVVEKALKIERAKIAK